MIPNISPIDESQLGEVQLENWERVGAQIEASERAFHSWKKGAVGERSELLKQLAGELRAGVEKGALLMAREMGKPLKEGRGEMEKCAWACDVYAENLEAWLASEKIQADGQSHEVRLEPLGPVLSIMPWNFPFWQMIRFAAPTLGAGNTTLMKHSLLTPGCAVYLCQLFRAAGFPPGVVENLVVDHEMVSRVIKDPRVRGMSLTGSTHAGVAVASQAGPLLKPVVLELGGSDPFIVLDDADIKLAAEHATVGRFLNSGQSCIAAKRIIVVKKVFDQFRSFFLENISKLKVGDPREEETGIGPLISVCASEALQAQLDDASSLGATITYPTEMKARQNAYFPPAVVEGITSKMCVFSEEVFGPVALLFKVQGEREAIELAKQSEYGLGASLWSRDRQRAQELARQLEVGSVFINSFTKSDPRVPFGGCKMSGLGRELSHHGIKAFCNIKAYNIY